MSTSFSTPSDATEGNEQRDGTLVAAALGCLAREDRRFLFVYDVATARNVYIAGAGEELFGIKREEMLDDPRAWRRALDPFDQASMSDLMGDLKSRGRLTREFRACGAGGEWRVLRASLILREIEGRSVVVGSVAEAQSTGKTDGPLAFRQAVEHAHEGLAVTDAQGNYLYLNREHLRLFGYQSETELIGCPWKIFYSEASIRYIEETVFPLLQAKGHWTGQLLARRKDGSEFHEGITLSLLPGGGIVCNCQDVSAQVHLSERLERSEVMFRTFLNTLPTAVTIRNLTGNYEFVNTASSAFLNMEVGPRGVRRNMSVCLSDEKVFAYWAAVDQRVAESGERVQFDFPIHWGERDWILDVEKLPLRSSSGQVTHVCTLINDVTKQRQLEQTAVETARHREEYAVMQREFISMVSHEFRTPLTAIQGVHYLLEKKFATAEGELAADAKRLLAMQQRAQDTLKELVDQVLLLNRLDHLSPDSGLEQTELAQFFADVVERLNLPLERSRIKLTTTLPAGFKARINGSHIRSALENLVSNGLKYSTAKTDVVVTVGLAEGHWTLTVADQGRGIPPEDQGKLFRPFYRARNVGTVSGTGLGLTIVRRVVDFHHGAIACESALETGTTFRLSFPTANPSEPAAPEEPRTSGSMLPFSKLRQSP